MIRKLIAVLVIGFVLVAAAVLYFYEPPGKGPEFPKAELDVLRADGTSIHYHVEVATTLEQEMFGLMFRKYMPQDHGMIFIYNPPQQVSMWMKDTYIPLDMLYVRADGTIEKIITEAQPLNYTPLSSDEPVHGVIELNAGEVAREGLKKGDKIVFPGFGQNP
ncbi:MAG TPA: DUF192 domain-containing protein [Alphaproteobacteria bacterium]|nr:DUF192 domain-containing protein [Alphaproteobacteria bacterium]